MAGIGGLENGYDIVKGNTQPTKYSGVLGDPGWTDYKVFDLFYSDPPEITSDGCFQRPSNVTLQPGGSCVYDVVHNSTADSSGYQMQLNASMRFDEKASALRGLMHQEFSASADFSFYDQATTSSSTSFYYATAVCKVYEASFPQSYLQHRFQRLHADFVSTVQQYLTAEYDAKKYADFVKSYGTHYAQSVVMGGRASIMSEFNSDALSSMTGGGFDFDGAVKADVAMKFAQASVETSVKIGGNADSYKTFIAARSSFHESCMGAGGSCPPANSALDTSLSDGNTWVKQVRADPVPVECKLNSLDYLFTKVWFPDDPDIESKRNNLLRFLADDYCQLVPGCLPPHVCTTTALPPMATAREDLAAAVFQNKLYAIGGYNGDCPSLNTVEVFDGTSWSAAPPMATARAGLAAAVFQNKLYANGGVVCADFSCGPLNEVEVFDGTSWSAAPGMGAARAGLAAAVFQNKLYAIGGEAIGRDNFSVEVFDGTSWSAAPPMANARVSRAAAVFQNKLYAIGDTSSVEVFDGTSWSAGPPMANARVGLAAAVFHNKLYAIGGHCVHHGDHGAGCVPVEVFDGDHFNSSVRECHATERAAITSFTPQVVLVV